MTDRSNFDIIKCGNFGCDFYHILITEGFSSKEEAETEIKRMIETLERNSK